MPEGVTTIRISEVDDTNPDLVTFDVVDQVRAQQIADGFKSTGAPTIVTCDGQTYRPFMVERTKPDWWRVSAVRLIMPKAP